MTNHSPGGTPADPTCVEAWATFEDQLAGYLADMVDAAEQDHLILELPGDDESGTAPYAQFAGFDGGTMIRGEVSSNAYLGAGFLLDERSTALLEDAGFVLQRDDEGAAQNWARDVPIAEARALASVVVVALRDVFGIAHPHLLTYQAWGPATEGIDVLGLCATSDVQVDPVVSPSRARRALGKTAYRPKTRAKLHELVGRLLAQKYDVEPVVDDDGDYVLEHMGQAVWVRVRSDQPAVEIMARVAHDVRSRRATSVEIGLLNRDHSWVWWTLIDRSICQSVLIPGFPFVPVHLDAMLDVFMEAMSTTRNDLALRVGGRTA